MQMESLDAAASAALPPEQLGLRIEVDDEKQL
jgi:hypothetical protein